MAKRLREQVLILEFHCPYNSFFKLKELVRAKKISGRFVVHEFRADYPNRSILRFLTKQELKMWEFLHPTEHHHLQVLNELKVELKEQPAISLKQLADAHLKYFPKNTVGSP